jgi:parallel beta-helix repeat protein
MEDAMRSRILAGLVAASGLVVGIGPALAMPELVVDDDHVQCPNAAFTTVQAAIDAASPGDRIRVCPGTYREQVSIRKRLHVRGENGAVVMPAGMVANTTSLFDGSPMAAAILVADAAHVFIEGLTVDGAANGIAGCRPILIGVFYRNASGRIDGVAVRNMKLGPGLEGCQSGNGILVQSGSGGSSKVEVSDSSVHDYQKNGITGTEAGTHLWARRNVVTGVGPTSGAAQNGIQVGPRARGVVEDNAVANHLWSPCVSASSCAAVATGVLVVEAREARVARNTIGGSQIGIALQGNGASAFANSVFDTAVFGGIVVSGDRNHVVGNTVTHSDEAGIYLFGDRNFIFGNRINEAPIGIWKLAGSSGNVLAGNRFSNTPILDPAAPAAPAVSLFR